MHDTGSYAEHAAIGTVFDAACPSRPILDQIADKWSMMVLAVLQQPARFNQIKRRLDGITQRVLTQTLRRLERNGMITRRVLTTSPVGVEYALTELGTSLQEPFGRLYDWTVLHADLVQRAQRAYDGRVGASGSAPQAAAGVPRHGRENGSAPPLSTVRSA